MARPKRRRKKSTPRPGGTGLRNPHNKGKKDAAKKLGSMFGSNTFNVNRGNKPPSMFNANRGVKIQRTARDANKRRPGKGIHLGI